MWFRCSIALPVRTATDASPAPSREPAHGSRGNVARLGLRSGGLPPPALCQFAWHTTSAHPNAGARDFKGACARRVRKRSGIGRGMGLLMAGSGRPGLPAGMPARQRPATGMAWTIRKGAAICSLVRGVSSVTACGSAGVDDLADARGGEIVAASQGRVVRAVAAGPADLFTWHWVGHVLQ